MISVRALFVFSGVAIAAATGCERTGVTYVARIPYSGGADGSGAADSGAQSDGDAAAIDGGSSVDASAPPAACPSGWSCNDVSYLSATDQSGSPVSATCGMGQQLITCNDADPASTCGDFTQPVCVHISLAGMDIVTCGQRCTP